MANDIEDLEVGLRLINASTNRNQKNLFQKDIQDIDSEVNKLERSFNRVGKQIAKAGTLATNLFSTKQINVKQFTETFNKLSNATKLIGTFNEAKSRMRSAGEANLYKAMGEKTKIVGKTTSEQIKENLLSQENAQYKISQANAQAKINEELLKSEEYETARRRVIESQLQLKEQERRIQVDIKNTQNSILKSTQTYSRADIPTAVKNVGNLKTEIKNVDNETKKVQKSTSSWLKTLFKFAAIFRFAKRLGASIGKLVNESGAWIENLNLFAVTFGNNYKQTLDWALEFADRLGVANNEIVQMTGLFKQLSTAIGITDELGDDLSQTLTQLAYDFTSFYNLANVEEASQKLQAGIFSGQIRTLRSLGIDVSQESVDTLLKTSEALNKFNISANQLTQSQKVIARVILTMQAGSNSFGDMSRSISTLQNRIRVLQGSLSNLRLAIGDALSNFASDAVAYMVGAVQAVTAAIRVFVPIKDELTYDIGDNIFTEIAEDAENANTAIGQLSFDKFESLTSGENENLLITQALTEELQKQQEIYSQVSSQFDGIDKKVKEIKASILQWIFPYAEINKETAEITKKNTTLNVTIKTIIATGETLWGLAKQYLTLMKDLSPVILNIATAVLALATSLISVLKELHLLYPVVVAFMAFKLLTKFAGLVKSIQDIGKAAKISSSAVIKLISSLSSTTMVKNLAQFSATAKGLTYSFGVLAAGFGIFVSNLDNLSTTAKVLIPVLAALAAVITGIAVARAAAAAGIAAPIQAGITAAALAAGITLAAGTALALATGFENGGIPEKSELFYMNERGVPEALINTGGSQTNVINQDQLRHLNKEGFKEAIYESGLLEAMKQSLVVDGKNINDSAFARAIFPALKTESKRQGGNQL